MKTSIIESLPRNRHRWRYVRWLLVLLIALCVAKGYEWAIRCVCIAVLIDDEIRHSLADSEAVRQELDRKEFRESWT